MADCDVCHMPLGSNKDCEACLKHLITRGTNEIDEERAKRAHTDAQRWLLEDAAAVPKKLSKLVANVRLLVDMVGAYFTRQYTVVPWLTIAACAFALIYVVSPIDLIPDFIPVAGSFDDAIVAALALRFVLGRTDRGVLLEHWRGDPRTLERIVRLVSLGSGGAPHAGL